MPNPRETWLPGGQSRAHTPREDALTTTPASFSELGTAVTCGTFPSLELGGRQGGGRGGPEGGVGRVKDLSSKAKRNEEN